MDYRLQVATLDDCENVRALIGRSIRHLGSADYTAEQIEAALLGAFGLDTQLISDGTYFVILTPDNQLVGCGGWSRRRTLFGSDSRSERDDAWLNPATEAAKIRAFFIDPAHVRRGLGRRILERCESEARDAGFQRLEMMATLPGVRLYEACGYTADPPINYPLVDGLQIQFVPMHKPMRQAGPPRERGISNQS
ncbi:MAG: GNAT family N-acetyltransferase [Steroidobacteraceae bacterium]